MLWLKAFHIIFMVTWFAGLFYLPRLFVYHALAGKGPTRDTLLVMQRRLLVMMHIGGALTWLFGLWLLWRRPELLEVGWMRLKLLLVVLLTAYHLWCRHLVRTFAAGLNRRSGRWYRVFNEFPTLILIAVVLLAVLKPF